MDKKENTIRNISLKLEKTDIEIVKIQCSADIDKFVRNFYFDDLTLFESMFLILLDKSNKTVGYAKISQGGTAGTVVDVKLIAKYAIDSLSASVIMVHNHPSGNKQPSQADIDVTKKVKQALKLFDINLLDHVIITEKDHYSFADESIL